MRRPLPPSPAAAGRAGAAAVVGADGFIGSHLGRALRLAGCPVISYTAADGSLPPHIRTVYFVAGRVTPSTAAQHPNQVAAEVDSFRRLLTAAQRPSDPPRVVLASSGGTVYAPTIAPPYREDHPVAPNNAYGLMKLEMESALLAQAGVEPVVVRLANIYGPGQHARRGLGVIAHWINALRRGEPVGLHGHPDSTRDYLYIDDATNLLVKIHTADTVPPVLNAGSGVPTRLAELAQLTLHTAGRPHLLVRYAPPRAVDRMHVWLDVALAHACLGWAPHTLLEDGLRRTWARALPDPATRDTFRSHGDIGDKSDPGFARVAVYGKP